jgi:hypothetical protein
MAAEASGKGQIDLWLDRDLDHAWQLVFHRVLNGDDAPMLGVELAERKV